MKVTFANKFHNTDYTTNIKKEFLSQDILIELDCHVYHDGADKNYAKRKLRDIKAHLCGHADCSCDGFVRQSYSGDK